MAKVVQWKFILPYESKVPVISFLRLSIYVKIRHFGLNKSAKRTAFRGPEPGFYEGGGGGSNETKVDQTTEMQFLSNSFLLRLVSF